MSEMKKKETIIIPSSIIGDITIKIDSGGKGPNDCLTSPCSWAPCCPTIRYTGSKLKYKLDCKNCPAYPIKQKMTFFEACAWWRRQYINLIELDYTEEDGSYE